MYFLFWLYDVFLFGFDVFILWIVYVRGRTLCFVFCFVFFYCFLFHIWYI